MSPDLTMCADAECPSRKSCFRYMAVASPRQSYTDFQRPKDEEKCSWFIDMWEGYEEKKDGENDRE